MNKSVLKIVADENIPAVETYFGHLGEIVRYPGRQLQREQLLDADILLVRSVTPVNEQLLTDTPVRFVGTCTIGTDHLDIHYLQQQGIAYSSAPGCNANSVVEYVFSALAALEVPWWQSQVGIIGCGNVGGHLYRQLKSLGLHCRVYDPLIASESIEDLTCLEEVLSADIVCVHAPLTKSGDHPSFHLLGEAELSQLRTGATLISAGRGAVIDNQALLKLLPQRPDLRIALDVWEPEPGLDIRLLEAVELGSPHIAGYSLDGKVTGTAMIYKALCDHLGLAAAAENNGLAAAGLEVDLTALNSNLCVGELLQTVILGAYNIRDDDKRLREMVVQSESDEARCLGFDLLRKHYPERREFRHWQVKLTPEQAALEIEFIHAGTKTQTEKKPLSNLLAAMGFKLTDIC
ncbi:4-phosphoerythronate dehydrogenase PdxB [Maricurvus nonylphenolicus]|uniref:4-phosphoerythronate dehydrogenase n=1 Tax=Maricurvus nonylphenolicus TaxID=1008307 RepID=UPI0036F22671